MMTPERWQQIKNLVQSVAAEDAATRSNVLQQSCAEDFAMRRGAEALLLLSQDATRKLPNDNGALLSPERWLRIEQVFQSALELESAGRAAYLDKACEGDAALRHEVESLLVYQAAAGGLIAGLIQDAAGTLPNAAQAKARFTPGTTLNKRYRIIGLLGQGGMGEVYRADDLKLGHPVALKFLTEKLSQDKQMLARFHSEVSMAHRVTHPNVCRVHDIGEVTTSAGTLHFLTMEYVDGEDLSSLLRRIGRLPADKAVEIANQLCAGLAAAHEANVLHRDLKPANVMIDGKGRVRITDFGLAGFAEQIRGAEVMAGTPAYMSPEQFAGKEVTTKSDIYALGLVLYELFTGKRVFEADSLDGLRRLHESSSPTNPSNWVKDIDPLVERVILRCLEKDPGKRLASAKQVADALPGGDPLAAALALGETPSPEMVAAMGQKTGMKPIYAVACLLTTIVALVVYAFLNDKVSLVLNTSLKQPPEAMASKAQDIIKQLGYPEQAEHSAYGFDGDQACLEYYEKLSNSPERWRPVREGKTPAIHFWYRQSPREFSPTTRAITRGLPPLVTTSDPPENVSGMLSVVLNPLGQLVRFGVVPPQVVDSSATTAEPDWKLAFRLAGLDFTRFTSTTPQWMPSPPGVSDIRMAWTGAYTDQPELPIRVETAAYRGKLVSFQIIAPYTMARPSEFPTVRGGKIRDLIFIVVLVGAIWLVRYNLRHGRGDRQGAFRLAAFVFISMMVSWVLGGGSNLVTMDPIIEGIGYALFHSAFIGLMYLALEPFVRRRWPNLLITWTRVLQGKMKDPMVGRDVLISIATVCVANLGDVFAHFYKRQFLDDSHWSYPLRGMRYTVGGGIGQITGALGISFVVFFLLFLLLLLTRRLWAGSGIVLLILVVALVTDSSASMIVAIVGTFFLVVFVTLMLRFGLLFGAIYLFASQIIGVNYLTLNVSAWHGGSAIFAYVVLLALGGYGFYTSLGGQKVFAGKLLEE
jgi:serine/threonine-protein kinase